MITESHVRSFANELRTELCASGATENIDTLSIKIEDAKASPSFRASREGLERLGCSTCVWTLNFCRYERVVTVGSQQPHLHAQDHAGGECATIDTDSRCIILRTACRTFKHSLIESSFNSRAFFPASHSTSWRMLSANACCTCTSTRLHRLLHGKGGQQKYLVVAVEDSEGWVIASRVVYV